MPTSPRVAIWLSAAVIAIAVLAAYAPGLHTPFHYDDLSTVVENESIRDLSALGRVLSPPANVTPTSARPLLNLSFAVDYATGALNVAGYHATNIAIHLVVALLLFAIVRATATWPAAGFGDRADIVAAATAAIWAVHPLQTGAVTYVSGRSESLMAVWYLATLLAAIRAHRSPRANAWMAASVVACALGMASKESMVTAPVAVLLYDRAYVYERFSEAFRTRWRLYAGLAATWTILVVLLWDAPHSDSAGFSTGVSPWTYLLNQAVVLPEYFRITAWPDYLLFAYGEARPLTLSDVGAMAVVVPVFIAAAIWMWYRAPALGFCALWVFLTLAPTSSIVPIATEAGAARRMYLPLAGIVALFVIGVFTLGDAMRRRRVANAPIFSRAALMAVVVALVATTAGQAAEFVSSERLWRGSVERWPSGLAYRNLAAVLLQQGRKAEGADALRAAADLNPVARYALGLQLFEQGRTEEAIVELRRTIREFPDDRTAALEGRRVLGRALRGQKRHAEAAEVYAEIAAITPDDLEPVLLRADELRAAGDLAGAHQAYQRVLALRPDHTGAMTNDGLALLQMGREAEALELLRNVVAQQPQRVDAYMNLAGALAAVGRPVDAAGTICRAIAVAPGDPAPRQFLGELRSAASAAGVRLPDCPRR
jgi:protein O-mannosyl-transferase